MKYQTENSMKIIFPLLVTKATFVLFEDRVSNYTEPAIFRRPFFNFSTPEQVQKVQKKRCYFNFDLKFNKKAFQ